MIETSAHEDVVNVLRRLNTYYSPRLVAEELATRRIISDEDSAQAQELITELLQGYHTYQQVADVLEEAGLLIPA